MKLRKPIRKISANQSPRLRLYRAIRAQFLMKNPICQACRPINDLVGFPLKDARFSDEIHHRHGKNGQLLFWEKGFIAVCFHCHRYIHDHPAKARELGLIAPIGQWNNTRF